MATLRVDGSLEIDYVFATAMMDEAVYLKIFITNTPFVLILPQRRSSHVIGLPSWPRGKAQDVTPLTRKTLAGLMTILLYLTLATLFQTTFALSPRTIRQHRAYSLGL